MVTKLTAAVVGCGRMGAFTSDSVKRQAPPFWFPLSHAEAVQAHPRLSLAAVCDVDPAAAERAASAYGVGRTFSDALAMIDEVRPSLLCVATRTPGRAALMMEAIDRGIRALHVEKPLCNGAAELRELAAFVDRPEVFVTYGAIRRFLPPYRLARQLADSGRYGPLREIRINMGGAGALFWSHPHSIDLILFGAGSRSVEGVQARLRGVVPTSSGSPRNVDSDPVVVSATIHFDDGVTGLLSQALGHDFILSCADAEIAVRANGGMVEIYAARDGSIFPSASPLEAEVADDGAQGTLAPLSQLVACLDGDHDAIAANQIIKADILSGQRIAFAMLQSHLANGSVVSPAAIDDSILIHGRTEGRYA